MQLRSLMGVYAPDLCGCTYKEVGGSFNGAVRELLVAGASGDGDELYVPEPAPTWADPRPVPPAHTEEFEVAGALAWVSNDAERVDALVDECGFAAAPFVGLDVEWTPSFVRGQAERPALLQLATRQRCVLVRINQMAARGAWPPRLRALLGADAPLKVGRGVGLDARRLEALGLDVGAVDELPGRLGLKQLAKEEAGLALPGAGRGFMTNWDVHGPLDHRSLAYAAFDAVAAAAVYGKVGGRGATTADAPKTAQAQRERARESGGDFLVSSDVNIYCAAARCRPAAASPTISPHHGAFARSLGRLRLLQLRALLLELLLVHHLEQLVHLLPALARRPLGELEAAVAVRLELRVDVGALGEEVLGDVDALSRTN